MGARAVDYGIQHRLGASGVTIAAGNRDPAETLQCSELRTKGASGFGRQGVEGWPDCSSEKREPLIWW